MSFTTTSKYVKIAPYMLMEYMYADLPTPENYFTNTGSPTVGYDKLVNGYRSNSVQIFNNSSSYSVTQNTTLDSVVRIAENSFVTLDSNLIIPFNDYSDLLTSTDNLPVTFPYNLDVIYDTVRYHIRAGYNLDNLDGVILGIDYQDDNLNYVTFSQIILKKGTSQKYVLNPNPVQIGQDIYDKYFEIKIPSLSDMNNKFIATPINFQPSSLAGLLSESGTGFVYSAPIRISVWQIQSTDDFAGYSRYNAVRSSLLSLEQVDPFSNIGCTIQESDKGQFFEYFATDDQGFIEDFILFQNSIGNSYYINHQIDVLEQIGVSIIQTSSFSSNQTTAYDTPNYYRPIIRNAAYASTFFLRYTMSLINTKDQSTTIRVASYSSNTPGQWGMSISPIMLNTFPQVQRIYNRVYDQPQITLAGYTNPQPTEIIKFTNVFIQQNYVTSTFTNLLINGGVLTDTNGTSNNQALGNGKLTIIVSPFDNYYKFKFLKSGPDSVPVAIDLSSSSNYNISFVDNQGNKNYVLSLSDNSIANPAMGELAFRVEESVSVKILQFTDRRFFIVNGGGTPVGATGSTLTGIAQGQTSISGSTSVIQSSASVTSMNNILNPASSKNQPASVIYWGYWKKEGETDAAPATTTSGATGATGTVIVKPVGSGTQGLGQVEPVVVTPPKPVILSITPVHLGATTASSNTGGGGGCFIEGTQITLSNGDIINIEDVTVGMELLTMNEKTGQLESGSVKNLIRPIVSSIIAIELENGNIINSTDEHPYYTYKKGWASFNPVKSMTIHNMDVLELLSEDSLIDKKGTPIRIKSISQLDPEIQTVYNFEISGNNNYFANGVLVHNKLSQVNGGGYTQHSSTSGIGLKGLE